LTPQSAGYNRQMTAPEHDPAPPARDDGDADDPDRDEPDQGDAYERAQPDSQPTVGSEPEPDDDPANAG
jgi:hypothetical protein